MFDPAIVEQPTPARTLIPHGLDQMTPGPFLAAILSSVDQSALSGYDLVVVLRAQSRMAAHYQAQAYRSINEVSHRTDPELAYSEEAAEFASDEIRAALTLTRRAATAELGLASDVCERLPDVWKALNGGTIDLRRARTIVHGIAHLPQTTAREVVTRIIGEAPRMTTGQLRAVIRRHCAKVDPDEAKERYDRSVTDRGVFTETDDDGTAGLFGLQLPPDRVSAASQRINRLARSLKSSAETRTIDQLRADVFLDLLCGTQHGDQPKGTVEIHVELSTLAELDDSPGELAGMGPVIADIARHVVAEQIDGHWSYTVTDQGRPVATGTTSRRPTNSQKRQLTAAYPTCVFPGCRIPTTQCDLDHRRPWAQGGDTTTTNLGPLCRHDHRLRDAGWDLDQHPNGDHQFTSPLGHSYITRRGRSP